MSSLNDAITYPMENDDWVKTILIGGVLTFFAFLLIPIFLVYGYIVRVLRHSMEGDPEPPEFGDWGELLVDGIKAFIVGFVYLLIPMIVGAVTVGGSVVSMATGTDAGVAAGLAGLAIGFLITFVLSLVFGYFAVVAIVNFAREDDLGAGFDFDTIRRVAFDGDYAVAWLLSVVVFIGAAFVAGVLNIIPFLGAIVGVFVTFYAQIVAANLWAGGFAAAVGEDVGSDRSDVDRTTA